MGLFISMYCYQYDYILTEKDTNHASGCLLNNM